MRSSIKLMTPFSVIGQLVQEFEPSAENHRVAAPC